MQNPTQNKQNQRPTNKKDNKKSTCQTDAFLCLTANYTVKR